jgi:NhaP-type Na+/H+ or K+/H+ antiporter
MAFGVVLFTLIAQGLTLSLIIKLLGVGRPAAEVPVS